MFNLDKSAVDARQLITGMYNAVGASMYQGLIEKLKKMQMLISRTNEAAESDRC